jgi:membrane protease YdiL (CAAX protease family)
MTLQKAVVNYGIPIVWLAIYLIIVVAGRKIDCIQAFRERMLKNFKAPLTIALICYFGYFLGTLNIKYLLNIPALVEIFCVSSFGLTLAESINGYEPLPVIKSIAMRKSPSKKIVFAVLFSLLIVVINFIISNIGFNMCLSIFHESNKTVQAMQMVPGKNKWLSFFTLLAGAGIFEEAVYRLFILTFCWKLFKRPWLALILSSLCFGLYHLTPMNSLYQVYWQFPIAQVVGAFLSGLIFGFFYIKRGFETSVLGHTLSDWLSVVIFLH